MLRFTGNEYCMTRVRYHAAVLWWILVGSALPSKLHVMGRLISPTCVYVEAHTPDVIADGPVLTGKIPKELGRLTKLKYLRLSCNQLLGKCAVYQ